MHDEMKLTRKERLILWNQCAILEALKPEDGEYYRKLQDILRNGFEFDYDELWRHIDSDVFSEAEAREVLDILSMFEAVQDSIGAKGKVEGVEEARLTFAGFDGNEEADHLAYLTFLVDQQKKFEHVVRQRNSHVPLLGHYRGMLKRYKEFGSPERMSTEQIKSMASAPPFAIRKRQGSESGGSFRIPGY